MYKNIKVKGCWCPDYKTLLNHRQSCAINGGFYIKRSSLQGDLILAYLFRIALEVLFALIKNKLT